MKTSSKLFALGMILMGFSVNANAQSASATALSSARIVTPISIVKVADMDFGSIAAGTGGMVVLTPESVRSSDGPVLVMQGVKPIAASFTVSGEGSYTYSITLPESLELVGSSSGSMKVNKFTSTPTSTGKLTGETGSVGNQTLLVGATLNVEASQPVGLYTNKSEFKVTVNYN